MRVTIPEPATLLAALLATAALACAPVRAAERNFPVTPFTALLQSGSADVEVRTGRDVSVVATGSEEALDRLDIRVEGERLILGTKRDSGGWNMNWKGVRIVVTTPTLSAATVAGSGSFTADRISGPFSARVSGSGNMRLPNVDSPTLALSVSGSSDVQAAGRCGSAAVVVSGSGDVDATALKCRSLTVQVSGSGNVAGNATDTAAVKVSGSGNVTVAGGARCTTAKSGSGTVRCS